MVWRGVVCASGMPGAPTGQSCAINQAGMCWGGQAELVIKVHRVRAWPSSASPVQDMSLQGRGTQVHVKPHEALAPVRGCL